MTIKGQFMSNKDIRNINKELNGKRKIIKEQDKLIDDMKDALENCVSAFNFFNKTGNSGYCKAIKVLNRLKGNKP